MALDFFGVQLTGEIEVFQGEKREAKRVELWVEKGGSALYPDLGALAYVSQIQTKLRLGMNADISMVLTPPFEDGLKLINSDLLQFGIGRLHVNMGYTTGTTEGGAAQQKTFSFNGLLMKPDVRIGTDITITMHARGVGYAMNITEGAEAISFEPGISYADAVQQVLQRYAKGGKSKTATSRSPTGTGSPGVEATLDLSELYKLFTEKEKDPKNGIPFFKDGNPAVPEVSSKSNKKRRKKAKKPEPRIIKGPRNDWWFVVETVKNFGLDLFIIGNKVIIADQARWMKNRAGLSTDNRKHFFLRGEIDPTRNMFPILSFSSPTTAVWIDAGVGRQVAKEWRTDKGKGNNGNPKQENEVNKDNAKITRSGPGGVDPTSTALGTSSQDAARNMPGNPETAYVREQLQAEFRDKQMKHGITAQITSLGIPGLIPGEVVEVKGFTPAKDWYTKKKSIFEHPYGVTEVVHSAGVGGFQTSFLCVSGLFPQEWQNAAAGIENVQKSEDTPPANTKQRTKKSAGGD